MAEQMAGELGRRGFLKLIASGAAGLVLREVADNMGIKAPEAKVLNRKHEYSEIIGGLETYGVEEPLDQARWDTLRENLNEENSEIKSNDPTLYSSLFVTESFLKDFNDKNDDSFQTYLKRHEKEMDRLLQVSDSGVGFAIRRLVVVKDDVFVQSSHEIAYIDKGVKDSDGVWIFDGISPKSEELSYFNTDQNIDYGLLHEWMHAIFRFPDGYSVDYNGPTNYPLFDWVHLDWRQYHGWRRPEYQNDLLSLSGETDKIVIGNYWSLELQKRNNNGVLHDLKWAFENGGLDPYVWPKDFSERVNLQFYREDGGIINVKELKIYRTTRDTSDPSGYAKVMVETPVYEGRAENIDPMSLFDTNNRLISVNEATLFAKFTDENGEPYWHWFDVRDLVVAKREKRGGSNVATIRAIGVNRWSSVGDSRFWKVESD